MFFEFCRAALRRRDPIGCWPVVLTSFLSSRGEDTIFGSKTPRGGGASGFGLEVSIEASSFRAALVRKPRLFGLRIQSLFMEHCKQVRKGFVHWAFDDIFSLDGVFKDVCSL